MPKYRVPVSRRRIRMPEYSLSLRKSVDARPHCITHCGSPGVRPNNVGRKKENAMKQSLTLLGLGAALLLSQVARADEIDWKKVEAPSGRPPR